MLFLSSQEKADWPHLAEEVLQGDAAPGQYDNEIRSNLLPVFHYYIGTMLAADGQRERGIDWLRAAAHYEGSRPFSASHLLGFLERNGGRLTMPVVVFRDPQAFLHFTQNPIMKVGRQKFVAECGETLPRFERPFSMMDIGCGDGGLTVLLLKQLTECGKVGEIREILLIDPSPAMVHLAEEKVRAAFPDLHITTECCRIQDLSAGIDRRFDLAISSLAYHHMPYEEKRIHLLQLKAWIDHFIIYEMDADNDTPQQHSPELALAVYQSYGGIIDCILSQDVPEEVATTCVDQFLISEIVSFFIHPRGTRTEYHMLQTQWHALFTECLSPEFSLRCCTPCYIDRYTTLFTMHYGRYESGSIERYRVSIR
ncbi:MAG: class I SAM-dependent methyltransferase [Methanocalculus sp.]|uniref:class I SAM-dependent methyltransferase n=1 Tax=Methanocalculus sp. TaxID=2004547 RepID=UPI00271AD623|nr:class I SAM-dependent methyltransferase [Methanocalculus sp.]MDO9538533.1 class I SAM-dependent methyltransferase [Methanocalculus sp.]